MPGQLSTIQHADLDDNGRFFLAHARTLHGEPLTFGIDLSRDAHGDSDDLTSPIVRVVSKLTFSERCRRFGMDGQRNLTEERIAAFARCYGDELEKRIITTDPYQRLPWAIACNRAGADLRDLLTRGEFRLAEVEQQ